jgi:hypothetical protein
MKRSKSKTRQRWLRRKNVWIRLIRTKVVTKVHRLPIDWIHEVRSGVIAIQKDIEEQVIQQILEEQNAPQAKTLQK